MTIGNRISTARKAKGYTQEYVAEQLNVSRQAVSKWEKDLSCPDTGNLIRLAQLLDTTVDHLAIGKKPESTRSGEKFYLGSLIPLFMMVVCHLIGLFSGEYTDMVTIPAGRGMRIGIPFLLYGQSPAAVALLVVSIVSLMMLVLLLFLGYYSNKSKNEG